MIKPSGFTLQRLDMVIEPEPGNPHEVEGILNPAAARGPDGQLYLFPRLVAKGNYSRIGIARVKFNAAGDPTAIERLGIALEPEAEYERRSDGGGALRGSSYHLRRTAPVLHHDLHGLFASRSTHRSGLVEGPVPLAAFGAGDLHSVSWDLSRRHGRQGRQPVSRRCPESVRSSGTCYSAQAAVSRDASRGNSMPPCIAHVGSRPRKHLDFLLPDGLR